MEVLAKLLKCREGAPSKETFLTLDTSISIREMIDRFNHLKKEYKSFTIDAGKFFLVVDFEEDFIHPEIEF